MHTTTDITEATVREGVEALLPELRQRASDAEVERRISDDTVADLVDAGLARLLVPRERGGLDLSLESWFELSRQISGISPSIGWCASLMMHLPHVIGMWPLEAQQEVWRDGPDVPVALSVAPAATVERIPGGYRLTGSSPFTSGVTYRTRTAVGGNDAGEWKWFILPMGSYEIKDTWHTVAMRGTGSNVVVTEGVEVPEYAAVVVADVVAGAAPGGRVNSDPKFRLPFASYSGLFVTSVMLGAVERAFDHLRTWLADGRLPSGEPRASVGETQVATGRIRARLDAAEQIQRRVVDASTDPNVSSLKLRAKAISDLSLATELMLNSIDDIVSLSGTSAFQEGNPVQQAWRDMHMAAAHVAVNRTLNFGHWGRMLLDQPLSPPVVH